jgi:hypothetical protein
MLLKPIENSLVFHLSFCYFCSAHDRENIIGGGEFPGVNWRFVAISILNAFLHSLKALTG